jgi:hypothetical protein
MSCEITFFFFQFFPQRTQFATGQKKHEKKVENLIQEFKKQQKIIIIINIMAMHGKKEPSSHVMHIHRHTKKNKKVDACAAFKLRL